MKKEINCLDFERAVFGLQHILSWIEFNRYQQIMAEYDPDEPTVRFSLWVPDKEKMVEKAWGKIRRTECERFVLFIGKKWIESFEIGEKQRVIVDYDPKNKKASIECIKAIPLRGSPEVLEKEKL